MATINRIADAIVAELNSHTFSQAFSAARRYVPDYQLADMDGLQVSVVPKSVVMAGGDRARSQADYQIDIGVQQRCEPNDNAALDALAELVEEIADHFRAKRLSSYPAAAWVRTEQTVLFAPEHIEQMGLFTSVLTLTYRAMR